MTLDKQDAELFYKLWLPLLDYVNKKYRIQPKLGSTSRDANRLAVKATADYLWSHIQVIDEYLSDTKLPKEHAQIIAGWKQCRPGRYIAERHLKKGTVFISEKEHTVYMVKGLVSTWEEMLGKDPVLLEAVLIPFRDSIISDGLVVPYPIRFGAEIRKSFNEIYLNAKANNAILYSLPGSQLGLKPENQCEVLREVKEGTDIPRMVKSVRKPPDQYAEFEDEEKLPEKKLQELLKLLPLTQKQTDDIYAYMASAANFYGLISLYDLYQLYNSQNPKVDAELFLMAASLFFCSENGGFFAIQKTEKLRHTPEEDMKDIEIAAPHLIFGDMEENARELRRKQRGKPLKVLPKKEFLRFADAFYFPETPQRNAMLRYLQGFTASLEMSPQEYCDVIQTSLVVDTPLQDVLNRAKEDGLTASSKWDLELFCKLFQDLNNTTHKFANRGYTPEEMRFVSHPEKRPTADQMSLFDMGGPRFQQTITGTPARNGPCPCGSGKKYKNCCGKK